MGLFAMEFSDKTTKTDQKKINKNNNNTKMGRKKKRN